MKMASILFAVMMGLTFAVTNSFAADEIKNAKRNINPSSKDQGVKIDVAFYLSVSKLPPRYIGNDFMKIFTVCKKQADRFVEQYKKSEFESNDHFQKRLSNKPNVQLPGNLKPEDVLAFSSKFSVVGITKEELEVIGLDPLDRGAVFSFDADEGITTITIVTFPPFFGADPMLVCGAI